FSRINGGQNLVAVAPDGSGKSTTIVLATLNKLKFTEEIAPRVLILVPDIESGEKLIDQFHTLNRNRSLRIYGLFVNQTSIDTQVLEVTDGVDIIVATPDRARSVYLKLGLNLNKIQLFIVDDADEIIKKGLQLPVVELGRGIPKAQNLIFTSVYHNRIEKMLDYFVENINIIEIDEFEKSDLPCVEQMLYQVPNFKTKLNLLNLLLSDKDIFDKAVVCVNSNFTLETVYKELSGKSPSIEIVSYKHEVFPEFSVSTINDFLLNPNSRILLINQDELEFVDLSSLPFVFFFDIPEEPNVFIQKVLIKSEAQEEQIVLVLSTELELSTVKKLEQKLGNKMNVMDLPEDLQIELESSRKKAIQEEEDSSRGGAFHEKKAKNQKKDNIKPAERYNKFKK
ncbi:DEAD/DEAH box helicase, partial [Pseudoxanthomonas sp. SGD-10]